jgi:SAM-dependent methyltransferase
MVVPVCTAGCVTFVNAHLTHVDVRGRNVLEVGARDVNGSVRPLIEALGPASYVGVDLQVGPCVDLLCDATRLEERFGQARFDVVVSTEMVEHVKDWRGAFHNMKSVLRPGGLILVTTRSRGFPIHGYPWDYWRYEQSDMEQIFADFEVLAIENDPESPGVFVIAKKPSSPFHSVEMAGIQLFSVIVGRRVSDVSPWSDRVFRLRFPGRVRNKLALRTRLHRIRDSSRSRATDGDSRGQ